jgi:DNA-binding response OmpR family regulator
LADAPYPVLLVVHPDPSVRGQIVDALAARGYQVILTDRPPGGRPDQTTGRGPTGRPIPSPATDSPLPSPDVVIADHTQLPLATTGQLLAVVPAAEQGAILAAFAAGADDVLAGPLRSAELATRVAILARTAAQVRLLSVGPIAIDTVARTVALAGQPLRLTRAEYDLLACLAAAPGRVFTKLELLRAISTDAPAPAPPPSLRSPRPTRRVDTHVARLRRRLGDHRAVLVTVWGVGYRLG